MPKHPHDKESWIENKLRLYGKELGYVVYKFVSPGSFGVPDRIFVNRCGIAIFIEMKARGLAKNLSVHQRHQIDRLKENGAPVYVVDHLQEGKDLLDYWLWKDKVG